MIFQTKDFYVDLVDNKDVNAIVDVYNSNKNFLVNHMDTEKVTYEWILEELESMKNSDFSSCKIVENTSGKIVGIIDFKIDEDAYLSLLMVHNNYKNKGVGKLIYETLEEYLKSVKSKSIRIDVVTDYDDKVIDFWIKHGFKKFENIKLNWTGKVLPAVVMKKSL
ncbi:GNAT family N-acetyltransferase [Clostridium sp.]|uniref:GNAT family N-acetyltransferase n=1 Tax=Clostridium sp. TaxID=1506 RepID=UPI002FC7C9C5